MEDKTNNKPQTVNWQPWEAIGVTLLVYVLAQFVGAILIVLYVLGGSLLGQPVSLDQITRNTTTLFLGNLAVASGMLALLWLYVKLVKHRGWRALGFNRLTVGLFAQALAGYAVYFAIFLSLSLVLNAAEPNLLDQEQDIGFDRHTTGAGLWLIFFSLVIVPPLVEEVVMRGFLYRGLRRGLSAWPATVITSLLFAVPHLQAFGEGSLVWVAAFDTFILSMVLCQLVERTSSLWPAILVHGFKNALAFATIFIFGLA